MFKRQKPMTEVIDESPILLTDVEKITRSDGMVFYIERPRLSHVIDGSYIVGYEVDQITGDTLQMIQRIPLREIAERKLLGWRNSDSTFHVID